MRKSEFASGRRVLFLRHCAGLLGVVGLLSVFAPEARADTTETAALLNAYYTYGLFENTVTSAMELTPDLSADEKEQISGSNAQWMSFSMKKLRTRLSGKISQNPKETFRTFVADYTEAEKSGDGLYLKELAEASGLDPEPETYGALRERYSSEQLDPQIRYCARYISEVQTWLDVKRRHADAPSLQQWLAKEPPAPASARKKPAKSSALSALAAAEAPLPEFVSFGDDDLNPMDAFTSKRSERRERVMEQAQAGMAQVAAERDAEEQAYAEKKSVAAQAEADAVSAQARKLAAAEADALSQRQNSWSSRFKKILSGTISGAVGAFTGGVGAEAGVRAADAVFNN
ncbi:MAG: hypothetical protein PHP44_15800 [Kiritimatiellae bacterium]|nr:hypothetical protein [Kiritimatiellia bacterium]